MFGLSFGEIVIVAILALVLLGPDQLPGAAKTIGKTIRDLKKATDGIKDQVEREFYETEKSIKSLLDAPDVPPVTAAAMQQATRPAGPVPGASRENIPGLDAALIEPAAAPEPPTAEAAPGPAKPA
jgi:sec-independent protein translocase protein TatB